MAAPAALHFTGNAEADALIARDPLALLIGFALDQQVTVQTAFAGPLKLRQRLGTLDAGAIAGTDPGRLEEMFRETPAIHRFPGAMARRVQELCAYVAAEYDGDAARLWTEAKDAKELERRIRALPGFGDMKVHGPERRPGQALRRRGRRAARPELPHARRRRLGPGARGVPGGQARLPERPSSRSYEGVNYRPERRCGKDDVRPLRSRLRAPATPRRDSADACIAAISGSRRGYEGSGRRDSRLLVLVLCEGASTAPPHRKASGVLSESVAPAGSRAIGRSRRRG